uniref:centrosomal protein of 170 kDa-like n=1 Tax=Myxine glutinosa TaxID=7769 RepID=UPI00358E06D7
MSVTSWFFVSSLGTRHRLPHELIFVGREDCEFVLQSRSVDKQHAVINYDKSKDEHLLKDLGSLNGTFVNDVRVPEQTYVTLRLGDSVRFGYDPNIYTAEKAEYMLAEEALSHEKYSSQFKVVQRSTEDHPSYDSSEADSQEIKPCAASQALPRQEMSEKQRQELPTHPIRGTPLYGQPTWWGEVGTEGQEQLEGADNEGSRNLTFLSSEKSGEKFKTSALTTNSPHTWNASIRPATWWGEVGTEGQEQLEGADNEGSRNLTFLSSEKSDALSMDSEAAYGQPKEVIGPCILRREPSYFEIPTKDLQVPVAEEVPASETTDINELPTKDPGTNQQELNNKESLAHATSVPGQAFTIEFDERVPGKVTMRDHVPAGSGTGRVLRKEHSGAGSQSAQSRVAEWLSQSKSASTCTRKLSRRSGVVGSCHGETSQHGQAAKSSKHDDGTQSDREEEVGGKTNTGRGGSLRNTLAKYRLEQQARQRPRDAEPDACAEAFTIEFFVDNETPRKRRSNSFSPGTDPDASPGESLQSLWTKLGQQHDKADTAILQVRPAMRPAADSMVTTRVIAYSTADCGPGTGSVTKIDSVCADHRTPPDGDVGQSLRDAGSDSGTYTIEDNDCRMAPIIAQGSTIDKASVFMELKDGLHWHSGLGGSMLIYPVTQVGHVTKQRVTSESASSGSSRYRSQWASLATTPNEVSPSFPPSVETMHDSSMTSSTADGVGESAFAISGALIEAQLSAVHMDRKRRALPTIPVSAERLGGDGVTMSSTNTFSNTSIGPSRLGECNDEIKKSDSPTMPSTGGWESWEINIRPIESDNLSPSICTKGKDQRSGETNRRSPPLSTVDVTAGYSESKKVHSATSNVTALEEGKVLKQDAFSIDRKHTEVAKPLKALPGLMAVKASLEEEAFGRPRSASESLPGKLEGRMKHTGRTLVRQGSFTKERPSGQFSIDVLPHISSSNISGPSTEGEGSMQEMGASKVTAMKATEVLTSEQFEGAYMHETPGRIFGQTLALETEPSEDVQDTSESSAKEWSTSYGHRRSNSASTEYSADTSLLLRDTEAVMAALEAKLGVPGCGTEPLSPGCSVSPESDIDTSSTVSLANGESRKRSLHKTGKKDMNSITACEKLVELRKSRFSDPGERLETYRRTRLLPEQSQMGVADWTTDEDKPTRRKVSGTSEARDHGSRSPGLTSTDDLMKTKLSSGRRASGPSKVMSVGSNAATTTASKPRPTRTSMLRRARLGDVSDNESADMDRASVTSDISTTSSTGQKTASTGLAAPSTAAARSKTMSRIDILSQPRRPRNPSASRSDTETISGRSAARSSFSARGVEAGKAGGPPLKGHGALGLARGRTGSDAREPRSRSSSSTHSSPSGSHWRHRLADYTSTSEDEVASSLARGGPRAPFRYRSSGALAPTCVQPLPPIPTPPSSLPGRPSCSATPTGRPPLHGSPRQPGTPTRRISTGSDAGGPTKASAKSDDEYLRHWTVHSEEIARISKDLAKDLAILAREIHSVTGDPEMGSSSGTAGSTTVSTPGSSIDAREELFPHIYDESLNFKKVPPLGDSDDIRGQGGSEGKEHIPAIIRMKTWSRDEVVLDALLLTSICQLSQKIRLATDKTSIKIRYLFKDQDLPWDVIESKLNFDSEVPLLKTSNKEFSLVLQDLRRMEKQLQVIDFIIDPDRVLETDAVCAKLVSGPASRKGRIFPGQPFSQSGPGVSAGASTLMVEDSSGLDRQLSEGKQRPKAL